MPDITHPAEEAERDVKRPSDRNARIWRYMDFTKYVDLLVRSALYFPRADALADPFEGSIAQPNAADRRKLTNQLVSMSAAQSGADRDIAAMLSTATRIQREWMFINCWHLGEHESAAMWELYASQAIAVQSTYAKLRDCLPYGTVGKPWVHVGLVTYINYETESIPEDTAFGPFVHKRKSFEHERELRAMIYEPRVTPLTGIYVDVDLRRLVDRVFVAPQSPSWVRDLVQSVSERYGLDKPIERSAMDAPAIF